MANADRLKSDRREHTPLRGGSYLFGEPLSVDDISAQTRLKAFDTLLANEKPQFQRSEATPERDPPVAIILHAIVDGGLQEARTRGHDAHQMQWIAHVIDAAI